MHGFYVFFFNGMALDYTGRPYMGVKILELILTADTLPPGPILVLTYNMVWISFYCLA